MTSPKLATWKPDCQGKQDYDADLIRLSSRSYPRGGGFSTYDTRTGKWTERDERPHIKPSAISSIYILNERVAEKDFTGETEAEVQQQVEAWADQVFKRIDAAVRAALVDCAPGGGA